MPWAKAWRRVELAATAILPAPSLRAKKVAARPMGPAPITSTLAPGLMLAIATPCRPTANGSIKAPSS
ncbi:hypothetical protein D3C86_2208950 [compost metagenome]